MSGTPKVFSEIHRQYKEGDISLLEMRQAECPAVSSVEGLMCFWRSVFWSHLLSGSWRNSAIAGRCADFYTLVGGSGDQSLLKIPWRKLLTFCTATFSISKSAFCPQSVLCVLCGSQNKQRLFPYTALTDWFL